MYPEYVLVNGHLHEVKGNTALLRIVRGPDRNHALLLQEDRRTCRHSSNCTGSTESLRFEHIGAGLYPQAGKVAAQCEGY